ncbi:MAG TPA: septum formation protein Maf [Spirochaetes bacterium]|nr:septum formation protein Maf [Spirochaetota bacterium]
MDSIVLASRSPRRKEILERLNIPYIAFDIDIDEKLTNVRNIKSSVMEVSKKKAAAGACHFSKGLVVGVDTVVYFNRKVLGKPENTGSAYKYIKMLSGNTHCVVSGITIRDTCGGNVYSACSLTEVSFIKMSDSEIKNYLAADEWKDKAGGYAIQGQAALYIKGILGSFYNVMGLPVEELYRLLKKFNYFESRGRYQPVNK